MGDLTLFTTESVVLLGALFLFAMTAFDAGRRTIWWTSLVFASAALVAASLSLGDRGEPFFEGIYLVDAFSQLLKLAIALGLTLTVLASRDTGSVQVHARKAAPARRRRSDAAGARVLHGAGACGGAARRRGVGAAPPAK